MSRSAFSLIEDGQGWTRRESRTGVWSDRARVGMDEYVSTVGAEGDPDAYRIRSVYAGIRFLL